MHFGRYTVCLSFWGHCLAFILKCIHFPNLKRQPTCISYLLTCSAELLKISTFHKIFVPHMKKHWVKSFLYIWPSLMTYFDIYYIRATQTEFIPPPPPPHPKWANQTPGAPFLQVLNPPLHNICHIPLEMNNVCIHWTL